MFLTLAGEEVLYKDYDKLKIDIVNFGSIP